MKKDKASPSLKKSSIARKTRLLSIKTAGLSVFISVIAALILFIAQSKIGIVNDVSNFLILGRDNIITIQRELGYDQLVGYEYAKKHIQEKFGFTNIRISDQAKHTCLLRKKVYAADDSIDVCLNPSLKYRLIKELHTLKGKKILVFEKSHRFAWETFINFTLIVMGLIFLFTLLFIWFYKEVMKVVFHPFYNVYRYLNGSDGSSIDASLLEVSELFEAIKQRSIAEAELAELNKKAAVFKAIATTTQMVAHDVRRPIDMVSKFVRRVSTLSNDNLVSYTKRNVPGIERATLDAYGMLEDLMDISAENRKISRESINLNEFLEVLISDFNDENIDLRVRFSEKVNLDASKLKRVFSNILRNAFDAARRPARFWIEAELKDGCLHVSLGNTGSSISQDCLETIFDAFYTSGKGHGKGLGMAIARKFVEDHGGEIWCESNGASGRYKAESTLFEDYVQFHILVPLNLTNFVDTTNLVSSV